MLGADGGHVQIREVGGRALRCPHLGEAPARGQEGPSQWQVPRLMSLPSIAPALGGVGQPVRAGSRSTPQVGSWRSLQSPRLAPRTPALRCGRGEGAEKEHTHFPAGSTKSLSFLSAE